MQSLAQFTAAIPKPQESLKVLPRAFIEKLFKRFIELYDNKFLAGRDIAAFENLKAVWAEHLADLTVPELSRGVAACRGVEWPPNIPEFRNMCRPPLDYETAFIEAAQVYGEQGATYSAPAIYWAAREVGGDMRKLAYSTLKGRWKTALDRAIAVGRLEIPKPAEALPEPGALAMTEAERNEKIAACWATLRAPR